MAIEFYKEFGDLGYLANYSDDGFYKNGIYYKSAEHYYQSEKFEDEKIKKRIIEAATPKEASVLGRSRDLKRKDNFREIKLGVMYTGVLEKFRQNSKIRTKLIETRNAAIREMTVKENYWGVGPNLDGKNHMGKILEAVRVKVKEELLLKIISNCRGRKVYVMGHKNPDADSIFSSLLLTRILKSMGVDARFGVRDENFSQRRLIFDYLCDNYEVVTDYSDKYFVLVDHNALDKIASDRVIGAIDHHQITGEVEDLIEIEYAATALLIYDLFREVYNFSKEELLLVALAVFADTDYLTSSRFSEEDEKLYESLGLELDEKEYQKKYFEITDFTRSISENLAVDYKEYNISNKKVRRSFITSYTDDKKKYYESYVLELKNNKIDLLIWCDYEVKKTYVHYRDIDLVFPYFTSSSNLVLEYLKEKNYL